MYGNKRTKYCLLLLTLGVCLVFLVTACGGNGGNGGNGAGFTNNNPGTGGGFNPGFSPTPTPGGSATPTPTPTPTITPTPTPGFNPVLSTNILSAPSVASVTGFATLQSHALIADCTLNRISRVDLVALSIVDSFVGFSANSCPTGLFIFGGYGYTAQRNLDLASRFDATTGQGLVNWQSNTSFLMVEPIGIATANNGLIFVLDRRPFENDRVFVINPVSNGIVQQILLSKEGSRSIHAQGDWVYVVNGGTTQFCFPPGCVNGFGIDLIYAPTAQSSTQPAASIPLYFSPVGTNPGIPVQIAVSPTQQVAYVGTENGWLYKIDMVSRSVLRGPQNPIVIASTTGLNRTRVDIDQAMGVTWVTTDSPEAVYLFDTVNDAIFTTYSLNTNAGVFEGPFHMSLADMGQYDDVVIFMEGSKSFSVVRTD